MRGWYNSVERVTYMCLLRWNLFWNSITKNAFEITCNKAVPMKISKWPIKWNFANERIIEMLREWPRWILCWSLFLLFTNLHKCPLIDHSLNTVVSPSYWQKCPLIGFSLISHSHILIGTTLIEVISNAIFVKKLSLNIY